MGKIYGQRWRILGKIGHGGQSEVFRAIDDRGEHQGEFALKRVLNPTRHQRFCNEIEAIKRLEHPNIVKLIDHSALDDGSQNVEKQFLVMPIAEGGDLSSPDRLSLYANALDGVLQVAGQLSGALGVAHEVGIIHRDIKPENILFTGHGHEAWVTDFGICLLRDFPRSTEASEVVGPRSFMAPELEDGGQLGVTPAADIYSFGKVIYYMITGGTVLPRERFHEETYSRIFANGGRYGLLQILLGRMICPLERRFQSVAEVVKGLENIEAWERNAVLLPISPEGLAGIDKLRRQALEAQRATVANQEVRAREAATIAAVVEGFEPWLRGEFERAAAHIRDDSALRCEARPLTAGSGEHWTVQKGPTTILSSLGGFELMLEQIGASAGLQHLLQVRLCEEKKGNVTVGVRPQEPAIQPMHDAELAVIPSYKQIRPEDRYLNKGLKGYFSRRELVGQILGQVKVSPRHTPRVAPSVTTSGVEAVTMAFHAEISQCTSFRASEWPNVVDRLRTSLQEAIDSFIEYVVTMGGNGVGPSGPPLRR
jgi:hypothetical protein